MSDNNSCKCCFSVRREVRLTFIGVLLSNMLLLSYLAQKCINKYKKFSQLLTNFQLYPHDKEIILNVKEYSLQLMHQRLKFSCSGYMNIDLKNCGKVTLIILVYITILVQFKLSDVSEGAVRATKFIFVRLTFIGVLLSNMLLLSYLAQKCINEYKKFSQLLNNFQLYPHDKEIILNVKEYSLQLMHQRLKFSCSGYMNIDLKNCGKVTLIILVYITILVQFKLSDVSEGAVRATKFIFENFFVILRSTLSVNVAAITSRTTVVERHTFFEEFVV
ncbi:hypothetical protein FF38_01178 [Lucilia cuprina]|uniref:Gustatory receptor n=1 Tax=Lucilia cuprina TaxID=7375 RepID=A0A0L0BX63_LUCCU|nr:hypothetical protein FF38_01178 [Lucilia cuprina]